MREVGIDISAEYPKPWTDEVVQAADVVVTMGCGDACPVFPGKRYLDWTLPDPAGLPVEQVRPIQDEIGRQGPPAACRPARPHRQLTSQPRNVVRQLSQGRGFG